MGLPEAASKTGSFKNEEPAEVNIGPRLLQIVMSIAYRLSMLRRYAIIDFLGRRLAVKSAEYAINRYCMCQGLCGSSTGRWRTGTERVPETKLWVSDTYALFVRIRVPREMQSLDVDERW